MIEHQIKMGRDALFNLFSANYMLIRKRKRKVHTTNSFHWLRKYPNLIKDFVPIASNQLWVSYNILGNRNWICIHKFYYRCLFS